MYVCTIPPALLARVDSFLELANTYQNEMLKQPLLLLRAKQYQYWLTGGGSTISMPPSFDVSMNLGSTHEVAMIYFYCVTSMYWQGHSKRCQYFIGKFATLETPDMCRELFITFIDGMNLFRLLKRTSRRGRNTFHRSKSTVLKAISKAIVVLKNAASLSSWNFQNKVRHNHQLIFVAVCLPLLTIWFLLLLVFLCWHITTKLFYLLIR
jgi:hypothetical protein